MARIPGELARSVGRALVNADGVHLAYVFGSRITGGARPDSDLDIAVLYDRALDARGRELARRGVVAALTDALGAVGERADVVDLARASSSLAFAVVRDGELAVERDRDERIGFEALTFRRYDDDGPWRATYRDAVLRGARRLAGPA